MDLFNISEWILKHFKVCVSEGLCNIFFQFDYSVPPHIYDFDTCQTWNYFYVHIIKNIVANNKQSDYDFFADYLLKKKDWEKLYYLVGKNFFLFLFLECRIYFKWGSNTYILWSNNINTLAKKCVSSIYSYQPQFSYYEGFDPDMNIDMYQILFSSVRPKELQKIIPQKDPTLLKNDILNQYVGQEIPGACEFRIKQMKCLKALVSNSPTVKDCKLILDGILHEQENEVTIKKVTLFLTKMIEKCIPYKLLFQRNFLHQFIKNMQRFLKFNTKQKLTLGFVMEGIAKNQDALRRNILAKTIIWLIDVFLIKIIRSLFYVSIGNKGNTLIFFKLEYWITAHKIYIRELVAHNQLLEVNDSVDDQLLKNVKFYPKSNGAGFRSIVTDSKLDKINKEKLKMCNIFLKQLIAFKKKSFPNPSKELHTAWSNYMKMRSKDAKCYFVKTDIKDAYGSIIHHKLKTVLKELFKGLDEKFILMEFEYKGKWGKIETIRQFINLPPSTGAKILTFKVGTEKKIPLSELTSFIFSYIDNIYVALSKKNYKIIKGVPQGGKLSASLCEIYYTFLDYEYLSQLSDFNKGDVLLRAVDDYMFISQDPQKINKFIEIMTKGISEYGMMIQNEKTVTNISEYNERNIGSNYCISFFGFNLDVKNGYITPCLKNYQNINIKSTISLNKLDKRVLLQKMSCIIALKLHPLLFDHTFQSTRTLLLNIHSACCVMAIKFIAIVQYLKVTNIILEEKYLLFCIKKAVSAIALYAYRKGEKAIEYNAAKKMGFKSFILIFRRKKYNFKLMEILQLKASHLSVRSKRVERYIKSVGKTFHPSLTCSLLS